jgi:hypothetical protein
VYAVYKNFVQVIRAVELVLGIDVPGLSLPSSFKKSTNFCTTLGSLSKLTSLFNPEVRSVLADSVPVLLQVGLQLEVDALKSGSASGLDTVNREALVTKYVVPHLRWFFLALTLIFSASWMSTGSTITRRTLRITRLAPKYTITISTTLSAYVPSYCKRSIIIAEIHIGCRGRNGRGIYGVHLQ